MKDILCIYYSRTGKTKQVMEEIARELDAELAEVHDDVNRAGFMGWLRCGLDSMRKTAQPVIEPETERPLEGYRLVILGTPTWAGRCSSVIRSYMKKNGRRIKNAAFVVTRSTEEKDDDVFQQMALYVPCGRVAEGSLRLGSVGYAFWREEFLRQVREFLETENDDPFKR